MLGAALALAQEPPPIGGGEATAEWPAVVAIVAYSRSSGYDIFCSGTLVGATEVLTCAHCLIRMGEYLDGGDEAYVVFGPDVWGGKTGFSEVAGMRWSADFEGDDTAEAVRTGSDLGVLRLAEPVEDVEPVPLNTEEVDGDWVGLELDYVGYGRTLYDASDEGYKRHARMPVSDVGANWIENDDSAEGQNVCPADSGSAVLRTFDDGVTRLVAVPAGLFWSQGEEPCEEGYGRSIRVDAQREAIDGWIAELAAEAAADTDEPADTPEPVTEQDEVAPGGCGCATPSGPPALVGLLAMAMLRRARARA